jgi:hypothetical protein
MTSLNNEIRDLNIDELTIEEMDTVTGGDSAILQLAKLVGQSPCMRAEAILATSPQRFPDN